MNPYREAGVKDNLALAIKLSEEKVDILVTGSISSQSLKSWVKRRSKCFALSVDQSWSLWKLRANIRCLR
jgi:diphthamide synthase (EF-2-diphthine--ammonia ligase)